MTQISCSWGGNVSISREDIEKVAVLARIKVDDKQVAALESDLGNILDLVDQLGAADTNDVAPMAHPLDAVQRLRADEVTETDQRAAFQAIAPATEDGLYLVPKVIE
jgi:aspartyl-tRNA(Asn)/glutamyl-tRNA(Gln) amidotransferase subunit C